MLVLAYSVKVELREMILLFAKMYGITEEFELTGYG